MSTHQTTDPAPGAAGYTIGRGQAQMMAPPPDGEVGVCECPCGCTNGGPDYQYAEVVHRPKHSVAGAEPQTYRLCAACVIVLGLRLARLIPA